MGWPDRVKLTLQELRTGFSMRVLQPGVIQAGDEWSLDERPIPCASLHALNGCFYHDFYPGLARVFAALRGPVRLLAEPVRR